MERIDKKGLVKIYGEKRGQNYASLLSNYLKEGGDKQDADYYQEQLLLRKTEIDTPTIIQLGTISRLAEEWCPDEVKKARRELEAFFIYRCGNVLKMREHYPLYFGSIQYGDPRNLDADVLVVKEGFLQEWDRQLFSIWGDNLIEWWKSQGLFNRKLTNEPHISAISLSEINLIKERYFPKFAWDYIFMVECYSEVFSGKPVFLQDQSKHKSAKVKILEFLKNDPLDRIIFNRSLQECLSVRLSRQK